MSDPATDSAVGGAGLKVAIIGGSGLGEGFSPAEARAHDVQTPFGPPSGPILETQLEGVPVLLLPRHGPGHVLPPGKVNYRANLFALKALGATHVLASGAVGSLREEYRPRDLVIPDQVIDRTTRRAGSFYEQAAVHVEFADPFCPVLRRLLMEASAGLEGVRVHDGGCYVCVEGPAFGSRAESHMHRILGGDVVGMTLLPEAKLAREAELPYAAVCLVTDYDSWRPHAPPADGATSGAALLEEIIQHLKDASARATALLHRCVALMADRRPELAECPAHQALDLAIWSEKGRIDAEEVQRLAPLWGRHFQGAGERVEVLSGTVPPAADPIGAVD